MPLTQQLLILLLQNTNRKPHSGRWKWLYGSANKSGRNGNKAIASAALGTFTRWLYHPISRAMSAVDLQLCIVFPVELPSAQWEKGCIILPPFGWYCVNNTVSWMYFTLMLEYCIGTASSHARCCTGIKSLSRDMFVDWVWAVMNVDGCVDWLDRSDAVLTVSRS